MKLLKPLFSVLLALATLAAGTVAVLVLLDEAKQRRYVRIDPTTEE